MNTMPFASQKTDAITFPAEEMTFAFFGGVSLGASTASVVFWSLALSGGENGQNNWVGLLQK